MAQAPPSTFLLTAHQDLLARVGNVNLDPVDNVVRGYQPLEGFDCKALAGIGAAISCGESVLRLAYTLEHHLDETRPFTLISDVPLMMTVNQLIRRLMRLGLDHFPVMSFHVESGLFVKLHGKTRSDGWCIAYIPSDLRPPPNRLLVPHYTFLRLSDGDIATTATHDAYLIYTKMPILPTAPLVFWRCCPTPENEEHFIRMRALGRACDCCHEVMCRHEVMFLRNNPGAQRVSWVSHRLQDGCLRAQFVGDCAPTGWRVETGPGQSVVVSDNVGNETVLYEGRSNATLVNMSHFFSLAGIDTFATRVATRAPLPFTRYLAHNTYEVPEDSTVVDIPPYTLKLNRYRDTNRTRLQINTLFSLVLAAGALIARCLRKPTLALALTVATAPSTYAAFQLLRGRHRWKYCFSVAPKKAPFSTGDLTIRLPGETEIASRLALRKEVSEADCADIVRRLANRSSWDIKRKIGKHEWAAWLERTLTEPAATPNLIPLPGCITCHSVHGQRKHGECKGCRKGRMTRPPPPVSYGWDSGVVRIGRIGIWSTPADMPSPNLKPDAKVIARFGKRQEFTTYAQVRSLAKKYGYDLSCRGWNSGPTFMGARPRCFPRGNGTALLAFAQRLGCARKYNCQLDAPDADYALQETIYHHMDLLGDRYTQSIEPESRDLFLSHFSGTKLKKMLDAETEVNLGNVKTYNEHNMSMSGFVKAEKSYQVMYDYWSRTEEREMKPRFICCPDPTVLFLMGPYTHAQTKWLATRFRHTDHLFYAGCATPDQLNDWLNWTLSENHEPVTFCDDISAMDANHNIRTFRWHTRQRTKQFGKTQVEVFFISEHTIRVRVGDHTCEVSFVNPSGVSDTSYKNSYLCLIVRLLAILHAVFDFTSTDYTLNQMVNMVLPLIFLSASGDDGILRLPSKLFGQDVQSESFRSRYLKVWELVGFSVKLEVFPPDRWRMATYLAMRPTWDGTRYTWTPEPARRLRGLFWQLDNSMHPTAWARGIASQLRSTAPNSPVLAPIADWFLKNTSGPTADVNLFSNPFSVFNGYIQTGVLTARAIEEFLVDYSLTATDYDVFLTFLNSSTDVYVDIHCHLLHTVFQMES